MVQATVTHPDLKTRKFLSLIGLDSMSTESFVCSELVNQLQLPRRKLREPIICKGLSDHSETLRHTARFTLSYGSFSVDIEACIVPEICRSATFLPRSEVGALTAGRRPQLQPMHAAVDILLSAPVTWQVIISVDSVPPPHEDWVVVKTRLGSCGIPLAVVNSSRQDEPVSLIANKELEKAFARFYSLELIGIAEQANDERRAEEVEAETLLKEKAYFKDGAWVMPLLFKPEARELLNNVRIAERRLRSLERKLAADPELKIAYLAEIQALIDRGDAHLSYLQHWNESWRRIQS